MQFVLAVLILFFYFSHQYSRALFGSSQLGMDCCLRRSKTKKYAMVQKNPMSYIISFVWMVPAGFVNTRHPRCVHPARVPGVSAGIATIARTKAKHTQRKHDIITECATKKIGKNSPSPRVLQQLWKPTNLVPPMVIESLRHRL